MQTVPPAGLRRWERITVHFAARPVPPCAAVVFMIYKKNLHRSVQIIASLKKEKEDGYERTLFIRCRRR